MVCGPHWGPSAGRNPRPACSRFIQSAGAFPWLQRTPSLCPESCQAAWQQPGPFPQTSSSRGGQGIWERDAPSGINKTNGQNQTPAFLRRQKAPREAVRRRECSVASFGCQSSQGSGCSYWLRQETAPPKHPSPSPHQGTGWMRFRILGPKGQDTLRPFQLRACWPGE